MAWSWYSTHAIDAIRTLVDGRAGAPYISDWRERPVVGLSSTFEFQFFRPEISITRCPRTGTSGSLASCRAASLFSSPSAQICLPFVTALRPDRPTPSPSGWPNACGWASGGLPPALPALGPSAASAAAPTAPPRPTSLASRGLEVYLKTLPGPCRDAVRGCIEVLSEIHFRC